MNATTPPRQKAIMPDLASDHKNLHELGKEVTHNLHVMWSNAFNVKKLRCQKVTI